MSTHGHRRSVNSQREINTGLGALLKENLRKQVILHAEFVYILIIFILHIYMYIYIYIYIYINIFEIRIGALRRQ